MNVAIPPQESPVPCPDKIDPDMSDPAFSDMFRGGAKQLVRQVLSGRPDAPPGARLAPSPAHSDPLLGHLRDARADSLGAFLRWRAEVGDLVRLSLGGMSAHLVFHPEHVATVLSSRSFIKPIHGRKAMSRALGNGLLVSEGSFWLRQRRIAQPAFHKKRIHGLGARMVTAADELADEWERRASTDQEFDVARDMMRLTLRIVQETLLGSAATADADRIGEAVTYLIEDVDHRISHLLHAPASWPTRRNREFARHKDLLDKTIFSMIRARRQGTSSDDLLSLLLETRDEDTGETMDDTQLRDELLTIFVAGHETTANALSWTFYLLGKHPDVGRKLRAELNEVLADRLPTADDVSALPYTKMVLSEAMRLYPPAWILARAPLTDFELGGCFIPAGSRVLLSPFVTHRHPGFWQDPEGFDPERFRDPKAIPRFAYFPFGGGPRLCIGNGFAMMEGILLLATLARRFRLELVPGQRVEPEALVTLRPKGGLRVVARPANPSS